MQRCAECGNRTFRAVEIDEGLSVGPIRFTGKVPARQCTQCQATYFEGSVIERFEKRAATELARLGADSKEALRFMRKAYGWRAVDVAEMLGVSAETISRWETGERPIEANALTLLHLLVLDESDGRSTVREQLLNRKSPPKFPSHIEVEQ